MVPQVQLPLKFHCRVVMDLFWQTWLQSLTYTGRATAYGVECFAWENPSLADTVYLESVQDRLPVMWQASYHPGSPTYQVPARQRRVMGWGLEHG
jgi:hypothetical protein